MIWISIHINYKSKNIFLLITMSFVEEFIKKNNSDNNTNKQIKIDE